MDTKPNTEIIDITKLRGVELPDRTDIMIHSVLISKGLEESDHKFCREAMVGIRDYAAETECGIKRVADQIDGISNGVLSQMYSGKYVGNYITRCRKLATFLAAREAARIYGRMDGYVETRIGQGLFRLLERTRYNHRIQTLQSPEQLGKSRVCREYAAKEGSRTVMVTLEDSGTCSPFSLFLRGLAESCGIITDHKRTMDVRCQLIAYLDNVDLVIIDEFHAVNDWPDKAVKALLDFIRKRLHADGQRGVIMISTNEDIGEQLDRFRRRAHYNMGQFHGRSCNDPMEIDPADIPLADVEALVTRYYHPGKRTLRKLHEVAVREGLGHFGFLLDVMDQAWSEHRLNEQKMTDTLVEECLASSLSTIAERDNI